MILLWIVIWFVSGYVFGVLGFVVFDDQDITVEILLKSILFGIVGLGTVVVFGLSLLINNESECVVIKKETVLNFLNRRNHLF